MAKHLKLIEDDPWLEPYESVIRGRLNRFDYLLKEIENEYGDLKTYAQWHKELGLHPNKKSNQITYTEWAPNAEWLALVGDFNDWDDQKNRLKPIGNGLWQVTISADLLRHKDLIKVRIKAANGIHDRLPTAVRRAVQNLSTHEFKGQYWEQQPFKWTDKGFKPSPKKPLIYECHIGMAQETEGVGTYSAFEEKILPRIKELGYNYIQLMAIMEHPYYGSYGYHVSNFFAPSSRFGTPEELKSLINTAHKMGIGVILDIIHSHAVKNFAEGLNDFDGSGNQFFHKGGRGYHTTWDSLLFDYGKKEVQRFLLSNISYWMEEFHFDGFRFDGITSMLYHHHGDFVSFDHYDKYFLDGVDWDAENYLQLANELIHSINPNAISIAEDMSGMPGLCRKIEDGGLGFDFRLAMGLPDYWVKTLETKRDEDWNMGELWHVMNNRRLNEKNIAYVESHDQAMVGDKTTAFWLMDKEMYTHMSIESQSLVVDRGIALHKMMRLLTISTGGEGYLNFIGNEFGHPEWIDFPREGNNWSYSYARRQWSLVDNGLLKYKFLNNFDKAMLELVKRNKILEDDFATLLNLDEQNLSLAYTRGKLVFICNFHPFRSIPDYQFPVMKKGEYKLILNSDEAQFGGFSRVDSKMDYKTSVYKKQHLLSIYLPNRTFLVFERIK